ncbi:MBL fold metallo-hydrolase [Mycolicibacterium austroafricanum]|uniref:Rhodanese-like domain-containing protein n=3 Tax=Mycolicibacterium TaxID=1866885 RepID=A0ABT8HJ49_MYCAO|nr:rhodanese-like domain-containing protein [Mycolicibacterium austroafricanum]MDN4520791.1 rhodanese-like domain-containing protein [Mycolicibacterium austroafricanum]MDN4522353.1 rhodanese-like domain-containing protein [Mycolicibacterium austroafricanum]QRZ08462.1 MBL fold metallo-hydrolase [Mycolicibacterium austroafricanum]QZT70113.1 MBL fold metallo-hydrolase [Mycolicibacterium austroafricanum]
MKFIQYYLDCLSHASYLIADETTGRAVVVDPQRDVAEYLADAKEFGYTIELVIETHFHADFLSGHLELAKATGAKIVYSAVAETEFESMGVADGERYSLGEVTLEFRHTPGHTPESLSIVVYEHAGDEVPYGVLTGDALFIGDVGRPDLLASIGFTREELADKLYDSLHTKLMTLPDATRVYPAHGAGSACGKNLSTDLWSTMGEQKATNYALRAPDKATFMELVTEGQPPAPSYFVYDAILNRKDRELLDETKMPEAMSYEQVRDAVKAGAVLVDGRNPEEFALGHLRGAINIGLEGRYAEFAGSVVPTDVDIVLFTEPGQELEGKTRLARIGFDRVIGYLERPFEAMLDHQDEVQVASRLTAKAFDARAAELADLQIVDVRNPGEVAAGMIPDAVSIPVGQLPARLGELDPAKPTVVYCAGGYRSSVAASLLRAHGFADVSDILGGYGAWDEAHQNA